MHACRVVADQETVSEERVREREHRIPPPLTVLNNKLQIAHPYDTGTFLDLDTQGGTALFHPRFAGWIHRVD